MRDAFRNVKRNRGAAGIDRISIELFENSLEQNWLALRRCLRDGTYSSRPLRRTHIPKGNGISPLLANIALNAFDGQLDPAGIRFVRYADDFVVLCQSEDKVEE